VDHNDRVAVGRPEIHLLGRFAVLIDGDEVPATAFGGRKVRRLIRVLAIRRGLHTTHDALTEALWPDRPPADPAANLGVLVNRARRALAAPTAIATGAGGYALTGDCTIDAEVFVAGVEAARAEATLPSYVSALRSWTGEPLPEDADAPWAGGYRLRLTQLHQSALEEAANLAVEAREPTLAVSFAQAAVATDPLREAAHLILARALSLSNDHAGALAALQVLRRTLADELGLDPSAEAVALQQRLLRGTPAVVPPAPTVPRAPAEGELPFVGRETQLAELIEVVGSSGIAVVTGAAGAGKSRLLAELGARLTVPMLVARAFQPEQAEAWSLARSLLREALASDPTLIDALPRRAAEALADIVPELTDAVGGTLDPQSRRALVLEGALRLLSAAAATGVVFVADDLQWADPDSLTLLGSLLERVTELGCVLAYRPEELPADAGLPTFLAALTDRRPVRRITLPGLSAADLAGFLDPAVANTIGKATDGTPFAVSEVIRTLIGRRALVSDRAGHWRAATPRTAELADELGRAGRRRTLRARAERYDRTEREVLGVLALVARQVSAHTVGAAIGLSAAAVLAALSNLAGGGMVRLGPRGWATTHDLVRETIAEGMADAERGRLHGMLAAALEAEGADPAELAAHHAGAGDAEAAARCYARAGAAVVEGSGGAQAIDLADAGLQLTTRPDIRRRLLDVRSQARARQGDLVGARQDIQDALAGCGPGAERAGLLDRLAMLFSGAEDLARASGLAEMAILEAGEDSAARARALEVAAILDMNLERPDRSRERSEAALELYTRSADAHGAARIMDSRAMATFLDGRIDAGIVLFRKVADLFTDSGDLLRAVTPQSTLGHALVFHGEPTAGFAQTEAALDLARALGHPEGQTYALWHRSEALAALGRTSGAIESAREGLAIAEGLGHRGWTATSLRALGIALTGRSDLDGACAAFTRSLQLSDGLSLFGSWAASRLARTLIAQGEVARAVPYTEQALAVGPPLAQYEARLARAELAAAREEPSLADLVADAVRRAEEGGACACVEPLRQLLRT
jgi:DNA-binding SARP family transcriptional activator/tetratricopeptide (TPR) repeat protein